MNLGMEANPAKAEAILMCKGKMAQKVLKQWARKQHQERRLLLCEGDPSQHIPLKSQAQYLGAVISYRSFESQTVQHRLQQGHYRYWALTKILHKRQGLKMKQRLAMWRACVWSSMSYALHDLPMSLTHVKKVRAAVMKCIRAITNTPVRITKVSDVSLLESLNVMSPLEMIQKQCAQAYQEMEKFGTAGGIDPQDWLYQMHEHYQQLQAEVMAMRDKKEYPASQTEPVVAENTWTCHICSKPFTSNKGFEIHLSKAHHVEKPAQIFIPSQHASEGLPQCKFCSKKFANWKIMRDHIQQGWCEKFQATDTMTAIPEDTTDS